MEFSNVIMVDQKIIKMWLMFNNPLYNLTAKEIDLMSCLIRHFLDIKSKTEDDVLANQLLFSTDKRKEIKKELHIKDNYFDVLMNKLRNHGAINNNQLNKKIVPKFCKKNSKDISLLVYFKAAS